MLDFILDFLYGATIGAIKNYRWVKWGYLNLSLAFFILYVSGSVRAMETFLSVLFIAVIIMGVWQYVLTIPLRLKIKEWENLFEEMKLKENDCLPFFQYERDLSPYTFVTAFKTTIPLSVWQNKKEAMEMLLNKKILSIVQDEENNQIISLIVQKEALPTKIDWKESFNDKESNKMYIGAGYFGAVHMDLEKHPHAFIAGETGSGKSNILKCLIHQALSKDFDVILIDFKRGVSFSDFDELVDIYFDYVPTAKILDDMVVETKKRLDLFREHRVDNIDDFNKVAHEYLARKIIFIDELAELLKIRDKAISNRLYDSIETLTRLSRAVGIHLIMGIQRPDSTIVSGQIKNNVSFRICGRFVDKEPSRIMLGCDSASRISNIKGRFIVKDNEMYEVQSFYYSSIDSYQLKPRHKIDGLAVDEEAPTRKSPLSRANEKNIAKGLDFDFSDIKK